MHAGPESACSLTGSLFSPLLCSSLHVLLDDVECLALSALRICTHLHIFARRPCRRINASFPSLQPRTFPFQRLYELHFAISFSKARQQLCLALADKVPSINSSCDSGILINHTSDDPIPMPRAPFTYRTSESHVSLIFMNYADPISFSDTTAPILQGLR